MNILYLHDVNSKLSDKKRMILEKHGNVFAPNFDYSKEKILSFKTIVKYVHPRKDVIIGCGLGAVNGFIGSNINGTPALLFNPPLMKYYKYSKAPQIVQGPKYLVLGAKDEVVDPRETLTFLKDHLQQKELEIKVYPYLGHEISSVFFKELVSDYFYNLKFTFRQGGCY
ncbi:hypothetical protein RM549_09195 [Salegentibacter sp. F188]|uniref:Alpha/beta hydrolase n=1 Tax=Autumnicola patrickiae TaxID=3075591 RepID=A0ABU3E1W8_9FLAO|nr:hypothetical protein [Salegentibacter sp. F188]MDT0689958.1 hypothetical protein [Salegentibacter sp. F188]